MSFSQDTWFLLIVVCMFYYHCYSQLSLLDHGYLLSIFMKTAIVPIITKNKNTSDKNKPTALVTAA